MQVTKGYTGTIAAGSYISGQYSWGYSSTNNFYPALIDFVNETVASFLSQECGVTKVAYEQRDGDTRRWLYIYDVPFLFFQSNNTTSLYLYAPYNRRSLSYWTFYDTGGATKYDFSLNFVGDPENGFALRARSRNYTYLSTPIYRFFPSTNLLNDKPALFWEPGATSIAQNMNINGWAFDSDENGKVIDPGTQSKYYRTQLEAFPIQKTNTPGKFPLVPVVFGVLKTKCFMHISSFGLPAAAGYTADAQTEIEISGRKFIVTCSDSSPSASYINMGLIEVTNNP